MAQSKTSAGATDQATTEEKPQRNRITKRKAVEEKVRSYFGAMDDATPDAMVAHWREDGVEDIVAVGVLRGRDELAATSPLCSPRCPTRARPSRARGRRRELRGRVAHRGNLDGEPFMGIEPTGKHIEIRGIDLFELKDGEIVSNTAYFDGMSVARQIGMLPPRARARTAP